MNIYPNGSAVSLTIPYADDAGSPLDVSSASYRVYDHLGVERVASAPIAVNVGDTEATIVVDAIANALGSELRVLMTVELALVTDVGTIYVKNERYVVEAGQWVVTGKNSFQGYERAVVLSMGMPNMDGWNAATERERMSALSEAYVRLCKLTYDTTPDLAGDQSRMVDVNWAYLITNIGLLTAAEIEALPALFLQALRMAQIAESDSILGGDPVGELRREGLMSKTVGESSQMYRPGKPLVMPVSDRAMRYLAGYVRRSLVVGRG